MKVKFVRIAAENIKNFVYVTREGKLNFFHKLHLPDRLNTDDFQRHRKTTRFYRDHFKVTLTQASAENYQKYFVLSYSLFPKYHQQSLIKKIITLRLSLTHQAFKYSISREQSCRFYSTCLRHTTCLYIWTEQENVWLWKKNIQATRVQYQEHRTCSNAVK